MTKPEVQRCPRCQFVMEYHTDNHDGRPGFGWWYCSVCDVYPCSPCKGTGDMRHAFELAEKETGRAAGGANE